MRLLFHNPQKDIFFGKTLLSIVTRSSSVKKYQYLLDYCINQKKGLFIYVDPSGTSLSMTGVSIPIKLEVYIWAFINGYNPFEVRVIADPNEINNDDILFSFVHDNLEGKNKYIKTIESTDFIKLFHTTHFISNTKKIAASFKRMKHSYFLGENNYSKNSKYFKTYFPDYKDNVYALPFVFDSRFKNITNFNNRKNMCFATGTLVELDKMKSYKKEFSEFISFFKVHTIHPIRAEIYNDRNNLKGLIDSYIGLLWDKKRMDYNDSNNIVYRLVSKLHNGFLLSKRKYYSFDMVEKFNDYRMFVVPEEINDTPGIGFVEGMASGCAYLGKVDPMYIDLGLKPGTHYIGYNGTLKDLVKKIEYYQKNSGDLKKIAETGCKYVRKHFTGPVVAKTFWNDLERICSDFIKHGKCRDINLKSSMSY